jgi:hypothetical protein
MSDRVWIVFNLLKKEEIEVFDNEDAATTYRKNQTKKWKLTSIVEREVYSI